MHKSRAWIALLGIYLLLLATSTVAQSKYNVVEVQVEGNRKVSPSLILGVSAIDLGSPLTPTTVTETIKRLYRLGIFKDVTVSAEETSNGLKVIILVDELPRLIGLNFEGNNKIKSKDISEKIGLAVGGYISPYLIYDKKNSIKKQYATKGYFQVEVEHTLTYSDDSTDAVLTYKINEHSKVKVREVIMTGNVQVESSSLIKKMRNRKRGFLKSSDFAQDEYPTDLEKVIEEYHKLGFIDAYLLSDSISIDSASNRMTIYLNVYEGPKYYFGNTTFEGYKKMRLKALEHSLKFKTGDIFDQEKYDESIYELYSTYQEIGHLHINLMDERVTRSDSIIDIAYTITEGLPSHINLVNITGNVKTKDKVIRRELKTLPGQIFNRSLLIRSVRDAMALNYFTNVVPIPMDKPNGDVDIEFQVEEKQTGQISAGAGYNSQDKLVGTVGMAIPNFRGNGQNVTFNIEFGKNRNSLLLSFTEPWMFGRPTLFGADIYTTNRLWYSDYTESREGASIKVGRRLRWPDNYFRVFASYRYERDKFHDFSDNYRAVNSQRRMELYDVNGDGDYDDEQPEIIDIGGGLIDTIPADIIRTFPTFEPFPGSVLEYDGQWNAASRLSLTITRDSRNLPEFTTAGSKISYTFENTGGIMGGFWNYQKHSISVAKFFPLIWKFALAARVQYRVVSSPKGDNRILISDRFTPGGTAYDGIVRGYDDGVLTPDSLITLGNEAQYFAGAPDTAHWVGDGFEVSETSLTTRVRGKYMFVTNLEIQFPVVEQQIYGLFFFDAGNSWLNKHDINLIDDLYKGVGFGFRIVVPAIGTIGFDFARNLDDYKGQGLGWKPHFQIGTTFR